VNPAAAAAAADAVVVALVVALVVVLLVALVVALAARLAAALATGLAAAQAAAQSAATVGIVAPAPIWAVAITALLPVVSASASVLVAGPAVVFWPHGVSSVVGLTQPAWPCLAQPAGAVAFAASLLSSLEEPEQQKAEMSKIQVEPQQQLPGLEFVVLQHQAGTFLLQKLR